LLLDAFHPVTDARERPDRDPEHFGRRRVSSAVSWSNSPSQTIRPNTAPQDLGRINLHEEYEVWTLKLNVFAQDLRKTAERVGIKKMSCSKF
jgi:Protein of unknown function (DUF3606)